jgi:hypothetical protein
MEVNGRDDIRRLLKTFGIKADEIVITHLARNPGDTPLQIQLILEDRNDYGDHPPEKPLYLNVEGEIRRRG